MRNIFTLLLLFFIFLEKNNAQTGVVFQKMTWQKALNEAKKTNKMVFLEAYTTWCAPCKMMEKDVFPRVPVGDFYNNNFVCIKIDMEKGEGLELARRFNIRAFPTFIFANAKGEMMHTDAGGKTIEQTLAMANLALNPLDRVSNLDKKFGEGGSADPDFLKNYLEKRFTLQNNSHQAAAEAFLNYQNDFSTPENMEFILKYIQNPGSKAFQYLLDNKTLFIKQFGKQKIESKIESCLFDELYKGTALTGTEAMSKVLQRQYGERADFYLARYQVTYATATYNTTDFLQSAEKYFTQFPPEDPAEWAAIALCTTQFPADKNLLKTALTWTENGIKQEDNFDCRFAQAKLFYHNGKNKKAKKMAKKAIDWAKKNGENASKAEKFLEDL